MTGHTTRCRYCGRAITQAETGRPRLFCNDVHRRWYVKATAAEARAFLADVDAAAAERELTEGRAAFVARELGELEEELLDLLRSCQSFARNLDWECDAVTRARVASVADELERTHARHFGRKGTS